MYVKHTEPYLYIQLSSWIWTLRFETCRRILKIKILTLQRGVTGRACIAKTSPIVEWRAVPACCTVLLIWLYLDNIGRKCNWTASFVFVKELALLWCIWQFLEMISSFFFSSRNLGFLFAVSNCTDGFMCLFNKEIKHKTNVIIIVT